MATALSPGPDTGFAVPRAHEVADDAVWFATLADSWLYGDLVHADPKAQAKAAGHTLNSRYSAAVLLYGQVAIHVIATLNFIRQAHASGLLSLDEKSFEGPVTANVPMRFQVAAMVQADVGTEPQMMLDLLDEARANQRVTRTDEAGHYTDPGEDKDAVSTPNWGDGAHYRHTSLGGVTRVAD